MVKFSFFYNDDVLKESIEVLDLSTRARNSLGRSKYLTIVDIIDKWGELERIRNLGVNTAKEIRAKVFSYNLNRIWNDEKLMARFAETLEVKKGLKEYGQG